ncbi:hypothetical protein, partial [Lactococcus lactis]|uniref:hypothetical protein n=1 Tax=Lactococcus lactis TaxID=1358 RepID=UPI0019688403
IKFYYDFFKFIATKRTSNICIFELIKYIQNFDRYFLNNESNTELLCPSLNLTIAENKLFFWGKEQTEMFFIFLLFFLILSID